MNGKLMMNKWRPRCNLPSMITDREKHFMHLAIAESEKGITAGHGGPFGCLVVKGDVVIASAHNMVQANNDPTAHAEVQAIRQACEALQHYQLDGCEMYCSCEPCPMCFGAIYWARPARVFFANTKHDAAGIGFDDAFIYEELDKEPKARTITMLQIQDDYALRVFAAWDRSGDKTLY